MQPKTVRPIRRVVHLALVLASLLSPARPAAGETPAAEPVDLKDIGAGALLWKSDRGLVPLPVVDMQVDLAVTGVMVRGTVAQSFLNSTPETIEAIYVFPLPEKAAVDATEMRVGDRRIRAVVREKEEARKTYETAKQEGRKAALLDQERPNLFTTSAANIKPGETILVRIQYLEEASYRDGEFGLVFPLAFTPRYAPAAADGRGPDRAVEAPFVRPDCPLAPRAVIEARIDAGVPLEGVRSTSHAITSEPDGTAFRIRLDGAPVVADRDFVLRWRALRGDLPAGSVLIEDRDGDRYGLLMLVPPTPESGTGEGLPTETLFVIDVSGSMDGPSIRQARESLLKAIDRLRPGDTFNIMKFNEHTEALSESFLPARVPELDGARDWIRGLEAGGGTELLRALREGLRMLAEADPWPARRLVLITDGAVSNEEGTLREVRRDLGETRLHILGIGYAPNRHLVRRLAEIGRGTFDFVARAEEVGARTDSFLARIDRPVMTGLSIRWDGAPPEEIYPRTLPDLYAGEPLFVSLRLRASPAAARAVLTGHVAGGPLRLDVEVLPGAARGSGIATRWARAKVEDLMDGLSLGADEAAVRQEVVAVALGFDLVTRFTSLVAVEEFPSADGTWRTRHVPGALPDGSTLLDGSLPHGGTSGPLMVIVGLTLLMVGSFAAWLGRFER